MPLIATKGAASAQGFGEFAQSAAPVYIEDVFSTWLYTGNGSTQTITNGIDLSGEGGMTWLKARNDNASHYLFDTARGRAYSIRSDSVGAQATSGSTDDLTSFNSNGFSLGLSSQTYVNANNINFVSWTFRKAKKFFDVVTYTGNGSNRTISHNLGSVPGCMIIKNLTNASNWAVYHRSLTATNRILLNTTGASGANSTYWNDTEPTSTVFTLGTVDAVNTSGDQYVAYLFAHDAGGFGLSGTDNVISCGSFTTDGSGNFSVSLGYEPQWVLYKSAGVSSWRIMDNMRGMPVNAAANALYPNTSDAESSELGVSPTATGFSNTSGAFPSSTTYIYIAIRRGPMKTPTTGTSVFSPSAYTGGTAGTSFNLGFVPDTLLTMRRNTSNFDILQSRLTGLQYMFTNDTAAETTASSGMPTWDANTGTTKLATATSVTGWNASGSTYANEAFARAPGFFDEVCFSSNSSAGATFSHNLAAVPELLIVKSRGTVGDWYVFGLAVGATASGQWYMKLNLTNALTGYEALTTNTSSSVTIKNGTLNDTNATQVAYLFASVSGVSKVGSYTGTGALQTVNCGFTGGSRFVLIKRTDSTGDWYVYDSARGISSGNDPYLFLNSTAAEVTGTNYVDTTSVGFQVTAAAPAGLNANGGTFLFFAIA